MLLTLTIKGDYDGAVAKLRDVLMNAGYAGGFRWRGDTDAESCWDLYVSDEDESFLRRVLQEWYNSENRWTGHPVPAGSLLLWTEHRS